VLRFRSALINKQLSIKNYELKFVIDDC